MSDYRKLRGWDIDNIEEISKVKNGEVLGLFDTGENCLTAFIKITDEEKFKKNIKQFIRIVERRFYDFGWEWTEAFTDLIKKCKDLGFKKARNTRTFDKVFNMQEIAPHFEYKTF